MRSLTAMNRTLAAALVLLAASSLAAASAHKAPQLAACPSKLDYVALASLADASNLLVGAGYPAGLAHTCVMAAEAPG